MAWRSGGALEWVAIGIRTVSAPGTFGVTSAARVTLRTNPLVTGSSSLVFRYGGKTGEDNVGILEGFHINNHIFCF